ncbi:hypothetical protein PoB_002541300 [Plakobranchus ocellatus]|uniref:Uncharacterized protein n=1 Tax=Plakobranchus ocellatus TaxID=259542 RepID=A0AAV3ZWU5_9GAST|nr:hypothetical protein PoB_002541300 [Plakobranchus ocellatus]
MRKEDLKVAQLTFSQDLHTKIFKESHCPFEESSTICIRNEWKTRKQQGRSRVTGSQLPFPAPKVSLKQLKLDQLKLKYIKDMLKFTIVQNREYYKALGVKN